jgi:hypothetical protein
MVGLLATWAGDALFGFGEGCLANGANDAGDVDDFR